MHNVMIDLETMGQSASAPIIALGAVTFGRSGLGDTFYETIDLQSSMDSGGAPDASTILWWMQQNDAARAEFKRKGKHLGSVLTAFSAWVMVMDPVIWGNGASFDNVILASAYRRLHLEIPWKFWNDRCYRTIKAAHPEITVIKSGTAHNALDDAKTQALHLIEINHKYPGYIV
jgi:exodeoxyribonuclease VIII